MLFVAHGELFLTFILRSGACSGMYVQVYLDWLSNYAVQLHLLRDS